MSTHERSNGRKWYAVGAYILRRVQREKGIVCYCEVNESRYVSEGGATFSHPLTSRDSAANMGFAVVAAASDSTAPTAARLLFPRGKLPQLVNLANIVRHRW